jgi:uncharacterized delta-60 repeat protein
VLLCLLSPAGARGDDGALDPSFGDDGTVTSGIGPGHDDLEAIAIDASGRIVAAGGSHTNTTATPPWFAFSVARYNADGTLDPSFGGDGTVLTSVGAYCDWGRAVAIDARGRVVVAGLSSMLNGTFCPSKASFALARYNPDGSLDRTFGDDGTVVTPMGGESWGNAVGIDGHGRIVVAGMNTVDTGGGAANESFAVARYDPDGHLDATFGAGGRVLTPVATYSGAEDLAFDREERIVVTGWGGCATPGSACTAATVRYRPDGALDTSFGGDGVVTTALGALENGSGSTAVRIDDGGGIVIAGSGVEPPPVDDVRFALARLLPDGRLDEGFGSGGIVRTAVGPNGSGTAKALAIDSQGRLVTAGGAAAEGGVRFALTRHDPLGALDLSFDGDGTVFTGGEVRGLGAQAVAVDPNGAIVAGGISWNGQNRDFALARYVVSTPPPAQPPPDAGATPGASDESAPPAAPEPDPAPDAPDGGGTSQEPEAWPPPPTPGGPAPPLIGAPPQSRPLSVIVRRSISLRRLLRHGLAVQTRGAAPSRVTIVLTRRRAVLARTSVRTRADGTLRVTLRVTGRRARRLRRARLPAPIRVRVDARDAAGRPAGSATTRLSLSK